LLSGVLQGQIAVAFFVNKHHTKSQQMADIRQTGVAFDPRTGGTAATATLKNNFESTQELEITVTNGSNAAEKIVLIPRHTGAKSAISLVDNYASKGITIVSKYGNTDATLDYMRNVAMHINAMRITTNNTANWENSIELSEFKPPFTAEQIRTIDLTKYRQSNASGFDEVLRITDVPFNSNPTLEMRVLNMAPGSIMTFKLKVDAVEDVALTSAL
jgi:predicted transcriptional regulator